MDSIFEFDSNQDCVHLTPQKTTNLVSVTSFEDQIFGIYEMA